MKYLYTRDESGNYYLIDYNPTSAIIHGLVHGITNISYDDYTLDYMQFSIGKIVFLPECKITDLVSDVPIHHKFSWSIDVTHDDKKHDDEKQSYLYSHPRWKRLIQLWK